MNALVPFALQQTVEDVASKGLFSLSHPERSLFHIASFIENYSKTFQSFKRESVLRSESILTMKRWSDFTKLSQAIYSDFYLLTAADKDNLFLKEGLCVAAIIQYFSQFFQTFSPLTAIPFPIKAEAMDDPKIQFYPIHHSDPALKEKTRHLRFLQAGYKIASSVKTTSSFEYVPKKLLHSLKLELTRRLPELADEGEDVYSIADLLKTIKNVENQFKKESGILLGLAGPENHSVSLYLQEPYHFFDPAFGLALASNKEDLLLFLANYISEKYPKHDSFALLEFSLIY